LIKFNDLIIAYVEYQNFILLGVIEESKQWKW